MKDTVKMPLAIQGSLPNLCDIQEMPIEQNRYYESNPVINIQNLSIESMVSNADFRELEFCAASSRLNLNEIGRSPKSPGVSKVQSPVIKRVQEDSPGSKRLLCFSPPRNKLSDDVRAVYRRETFTVKNKQPKSPYVFAVPKVPRDFNMRGSSTQISQSLVSLSSSSTSIASTSSMPASRATNGKLYNENIINSYSKKDPFSATTTEDPFLSSSMYLDERTLDGIEKSFMKWLNALVTIPPDLESKRDEKIDVAKLFNDVQNKDLTLAPTKEIVCSQYYTCELIFLFFNFFDI
jgi:abnormal spindle-like microcephaly-associated protein